MVDGKTVREDFNEEKEKLSKMTYAQKKEHIWMYYKIPIISAVVIIAAIIGIIRMYRMNNYDTVFYTVVADGRMEGMSEKKDALTTGFTEYLGIDGKSERVYFDNNYSLQYTNALDQDAYISAEKLYTQIATGSIDAIIANVKLINGFSTDEESSLIDLRDHLSAEELAAVDEHLVYYTLKDGSRIPNALTLTGTKVVDEMGLQMEEPCFGITISSTHIDNGIEFIRYVFELPPQ